MANIYLNNGDKVKFIRNGNGIETDVREGYFMVGRREQHTVHEFLNGYFTIYKMHNITIIGRAEDSDYSEPEVTAWGARVLPVVVIAVAGLVVALLVLGLVSA